MIIDAHAHVFSQPRIKYMNGDYKFMSAEEQIQIMDKLGIDMAVILPLSNPESSPEVQGIDEILGICEKYPGRFIPFCNIDPRITNFLFKVDDKYFEFLLEQYKQLGCLGIGEITAKIYWDDPKLLQLLKAAEKIGFPVTFHTCTAGTDDYGLIDEMGFPRFEKVLQKFPNLIFLAHSNAWWAEISGDVKLEQKVDYPTGPVKPGGAVAKLMRTNPQLYSDISANSGINALMRDPAYAYEFIDEFQDKLVFGLDFCSVKNDRPHINWLKDARDQGNISNQAYEKIMWKNINKILKMDTKI